MSYLSPLLIYNVITFWGWGGLLAKQRVCMHFERMMWYMYSRSLSALAPQWATSWQHRGRWPTGSTRHTWFGSLWIVWSLGSTYSSTSRPLSRSSRPAACREQGRKGGREGDNNNNNNFIITLKQLLIQTLCVLWRSWENQVSVQLSLSAVSLDKSKLVEKYSLKSTTLSMPNLVRSG